MKAKIAEIFKSIQGEGVYLGREQLFIRFFGCNLNRCRFCDTSLYSFDEYDAYDLVELIKLSFDDFHSISLTGGEPLLQKDFLKEFLPLVKQYGFKTYLETNSTLPEALSEVIDYIDIVALDFKLPSSTGLQVLWNEHKDFLGIALQRETFVKAVICNTTQIEDLRRAVKILSSFNRSIPFILQPDSFEFDMKLMGKIKEFREFSLGSLSDVRVIPQMHKLAGIK